MSDSVQAYLASKRTVDDRALNRRVWSRLADELAACARGRNEPVRIVEVGAGVGAMIARLAAWDALPPRVSYRAVDVDAGSIAFAKANLPTWLESAGYAVERTADGLLARRDDRCTLEIALEPADAFSIADEADAVIAAAFLDVVDLERALTTLPELVRDGGLFYAPITFDGGTAVSPVDPLDETIERLYHRHMDELRDQPGSSRAGRRLMTRLPAHGHDVLAAGGADWLVSPHDSGYPADEAAFLRHLLETIDGALTDYSNDALEPSARERWVERRRRELERGELVLVAHHLDVLARV